MSQEKMPAPNEVWRHTNGAEYRVELVTNISYANDRHPPDVVYRSIATGNAWSRRLSDWHRSMTFVREF